MDETQTPNVKVSFDNSTQVIATTAVVTATVMGTMAAMSVAATLTLKAVNRINRRLEKENAK